MNEKSKIIKYVVVRNNIRTSDTEYDSVDGAADEMTHWNKILNRWPDGTSVRVVEKDNQLHRVYSL